MNVLALVVAGAAAPASGLGQDARAVVCGALDRPARELAAVVESTGEAGRSTLATMAEAGGAEAECGLAGLAAVRDRRVVSLLAAAIRRAPATADVWRLVRWAAFVAGGPDTAIAAPLAALLPVLDSPAARAAAGDDTLRLFGELDVAEARDRLVAALDRPQPDGALDATVHALARQRDPRARARISAIGAELAAGLAGNATYEQARRLGAVAFYLLALGPDTEREGMAMLARLSPQDQADSAAWTMATLCEHAARHPGTRAASTAQREGLAAAFGGAGVRWESLTRGAFPCP